MPRTFASINGSGQKPDSTSRSTALAGPSRIANEGSVDSTDGNEELPVGGIGFRQKRTLSELSYSPSEPSRPRKIFRSGGEQTDSQPVHPACRACRRAHQKCDRKKPICAPCYKNKIGTIPSYLPCMELPSVYLSSNNRLHLAPAWRITRRVSSRARSSGRP